MKKVLLISIVLCLFFAGCSNDEVETVGDQTQRNSFIEQTIPGIYNGGEALMMFQEDTHQMAYTTDKKSWRLQNDNLSVYVSCVLNDVAAVNKELTAIVKSKGVEGVAAGEQVAVVLKVENDKCWIWLVDSSIGILTDMK